MPHCAFRGSAAAGWLTGNPLGPACPVQNWTSGNCSTTRRRRLALLLRPQQASGRCGVARRPAAATNTPTSASGKRSAMCRRRFVSSSGRSKRAALDGFQQLQPMFQNRAALIEALPRSKKRHVAPAFRTLISRRVPSASRYFQEISALTPIAATVVSVATRHWRPPLRRSPLLCRGTRDLRWWWL
jgi:hypothetical protein